MLSTCFGLLVLAVVACDGDGADAPAGSSSTGATATATVAPPVVEATATASPTTTHRPAPSVTPAGTRVAPQFANADAGRAFEHIRVLVVEIGSRVSSSDAEREAAEYIASQLRAAGYAVTMEPFDVEITRDESTVRLPGGAELESTRVLAGSPNASASGRIKLGGLGRPSDLAGVDAEGAVLLLDRDLITFAEKARNAEAAGAIAVIVVNNVPGAPLRGSLGDEAVSIPVVGISTDDGAALDLLVGEELISEAEPVTVSANLRVETAQSQNVVGRASERCDFYLGAHYDSVEAGPGANDNASGTAAMIELARTHRVDGLCAIAFGSEENGLHGSRAFVRAHDVEGARFMLNFDMVAKISSPFFVATTGSASSRDLADRAAAVATELGFDMPRGAFPRFASSDHESFSTAGVPAITVHSGDDPLIHEPRDDLDNVSRDDLATMLDVAAAVLRTLIVDFLLVE